MSPQQPRSSSGGPRRGSGSGVGGGALGPFGHADEAESVRRAVAADIAERGDTRRSTSEVGDAIVTRIGALETQRI